MSPQHWGVGDGGEGDKGEIKGKRWEGGDMGGTAWGLVVTSFDEVAGGKK